MKKKLKIIIPIVVLVVILAVGAALYFFTDLFKSPKKLFYKYIGKTFQSEKDYTYDNFLDELNFYYGKACKTNAEVTLDAKLDHTSEEANLDGLKDIKLTLLSEVGPKQEKSYSKIGLDYKNENLTNMEFLNSNNSFGLKCNDIYKDYFYVENSNLKALATKMGLESNNIPDSISKINIYDLLYVSKDTRKSIYDRYYKIIDSKLDKDHFEADKGVEVDVNNKTIKADKYTLTLTEEDINNILLETFKTLKDDDQTLDLLLDKSKMVSDSVGSTELSKQDIKDSLEETISSLESSKSSKSSKSANIRISVYEYKGKTAKLTIKSDGEVIGLDITQNKKDGTIRFYVESNDKVVLNIKNEYTIDGDTTNGTISMTSNDSDIMKIQYTLVKSKSKISLEAKCILISTNSDENIAILFKYEATGDNLDKKPTKFDFNGYLKFVNDADNSDSDYIAINYKGNTEYTDSIDIPELGQSNGVCINTVTDEELETIKTDINTNINTFIDKILGKFDTTRTEAGISEEPIDFFTEVEDTTKELSNSIESKTLLNKQTKVNTLKNTNIKNTTGIENNVKSTDDTISFSL